MSAFQPQQREKSLIKAVQTKNDAALKALFTPKQLAEAIRTQNPVLISCYAWAAVNLKDAALQSWALGQLVTPDHIAWVRDSRNGDAIADMVCGIHGLQDSGQRQAGLEDLLTSENYRATRRLTPGRSEAYAETIANTAALVATGLPRDSAIGVFEKLLSRSRIACVLNFGSTHSHLDLLKAAAVWYGPRSFSQSHDERALAIPIAYARHFVDSKAQQPYFADRMHVVVDMLEATLNTHFNVPVHGPVIEIDIDPESPHTHLTWRTQTRGQQSLLLHTSAAAEVEDSLYAQQRPSKSRRLETSSAAVAPEAKRPPPPSPHPASPAAAAGSGQASVAPPSPSPERVEGRALSAMVGVG